MIFFNAMVRGFSVSFYRIWFFLFIPGLFFVFVTGFAFNSATANALEQPPNVVERQTGVSGYNLDEAALKANVAARIRTARGVQDERFRQFSPDLVSIDKKIPINIQGMTFFAVSLKILSPPDAALGESSTSLVVDKSGTLQITDIQNLASGNSLLQDALNQLVSHEDIPPDFGKEIFSGTGDYSMIVISDPFCPHCRRGWNYIKEQEEKFKTVRLAHFPLNRPAEVACMVMADAHSRQFKLFEIVDFAYTLLNPVPKADDILKQFMDAFPELQETWGEDPASALKYLEENFLAVVQEERQKAQGMGINSTPVFFVNNEFIRGFNAEKLDKAMP